MGDQKGQGFGSHHQPHHYQPVRKPAAPPPPPLSEFKGKDAEDLHAWSLFRQNLNANFSESALGIGGEKGKVNNSATANHHSSSNGNFQLRESTVNNILSHPKYGAQLKNQDAFTYLRFGLPRVKASNIEPKQQQQQPRTNGGAVSAAINEELKRRFWSSDTNLLREMDSDSSGKETHHNSPPANQPQQHYHRGSPPKSPPSHPQPYINRYDKAKQNRNAAAIRATHSVADLRFNQRKYEQFEEKADHRGEDHPGYPRGSPYGAGNGDNTDNEDIRLDESMPSHGGGNNPPPSSLPPPLAKHPHLVVKDLMYEIDKSPNWRRVCGFSRQKLRILEDVSFDVRSGELMAVMATSVVEGSALMDVLANRHDRRNGTVRAEIYLNGVTLTPKHLNRVMAYVCRTMHFCPDMSPRQALLFAGLLMGPAARGSTDIKRRTRTLLEELNLGEVHHTRLSELTDSERRRLHIAMHLILDTEILILDQPLLGLDIFDAFFLVEYLRQWAMVGGKCVIMTMSPPTYEVFTMINRVLLISAGRSLFVGPRRDFIKYFTSLDFPCPPFKNPSDYYLDLVTLDDLSQEALLESSQRIENLAEIHARRPLVELFSSMPGPPAGTPPPFRRANFAMQFLALWIRALIFSFPYNVVQLFLRFLTALTLSLVIGGIFWQVRTGREQEHVWDRIGFISTLLTVGIVPLLAGELWNAHAEKQHILAEVSQGFYSLPVYLVAKMLYSAPQSILIGLAYALPACSMAGLQLHVGANSLPLYLLLMLAYYFALRTFVYASVWICKRRSTAAILFGLIFIVFTLSSGITIQQRDLAFTHRWLRQLSPVRWLHETLIGWEFEPNVLQPLATTNTADSSSPVPAAFLCSRNPVVQQPNAILVRADCGFQNRANVLKWFEYQGSTNQTLRSTWHSFTALLALYLVSFVVGSIILCVRVYYYRDGIKSKNGERIAT